MNWIFWRNEKTNDTGDNVWLIIAMIIMRRLVYDDGIILRVILMGNNLGIMIGFYWSIMKLYEVQEVILRFLFD